MVSISSADIQHEQLQSQRQQQQLQQHHRHHHHSDESHWYVVCACQAERLFGRAYYLFISNRRILNAFICVRYFLNHFWLSSFLSFFCSFLLTKWNGCMCSKKKAWINWRNLQIINQLNNIPKVFFNLCVV